MKRICLALAAVVVAGCSAAPKASRWMDPAAKGKSFSNLAVFALANDEQVGRTAERTLAGALTGGTRAVPGHTFIPQKQYKDKDAVIAKLKEKGFDGAVVAHVLAIDEKQSEGTGAYAYSVSYYGGFGGYWGTYAPVSYMSTTVKEQYVQIETLLYDLRSDTLVWAGQTQLKDPDSTLSVLQDVAKSAAESMRADQLIAK